MIARGIPVIVAEQIWRVAEEFLNNDGSRINVVIGGELFPGHVRASRESQLDNLCGVALRGTMFIKSIWRGNSN